MVVEEGTAPVLLQTGAAVDLGGAAGPGGATGPGGAALPRPGGAALPVPAAALLLRRRRRTEGKGGPPCRAPPRNRPLPLRPPARRAPVPLTALCHGGGGKAHHPSVQHHGDRVLSKHFLGQKAVPGNNPCLC